MIPSRFAVSLTVSRYGPGSYVNGQWLEYQPQTLTITATVQPMTEIERQMLPEATRQRGTVKIYSDAALRPLDEHTQTSGDRFDWNGRKWEVIASEHQTFGTLAHYKSMAALVDLESEHCYEY